MSNNNEKKKKNTITPFEQRKYLLNPSKGKKFWRVIMLQYYAIRRVQINLRSI